MRSVINLSNVEQNVLGIFKSGLKRRLSNWKRVISLKNMSSRSFLQMLVLKALREATRGKGTPHQLVPSGVKVSFGTILLYGLLMDFVKFQKKICLAGLANFVALTFICFSDHEIGTIIRIRLPLKKDRDTSVRNEQLCSTSGRVDFHCQQKNESVNVLEHCRTTSAKECILVEDVTPSPKEKLPFTVPGEIEATANQNEIGRTESVCNALIEDWVPPAPQYQGDDFDNEEWLFKTKQEDRRGSNRYKAGNEVTCSRSRSLWPHAHYMPDADIYALPYTIPF